MWKVFFFLCFFLGGEEGFEGRELEKQLRVGWGKGRRWKGAVSGREKWGRGVTGLEIRGGRFWEGNFGVMWEGRDQRGVFPPSFPFFGFLWEELLGEVFFIV